MPMSWSWGAPSSRRWLPSRVCAFTVWPTKAACRTGWPRSPSVSGTCRRARLPRKLAAAGIYVWDGNYYALNVSERLGVEESGGMVRVGAAHYNTLEEVERLKETLLKISVG